MIEQAHIIVKLEDIAGYQQPFVCLHQRCPGMFPSVETRMEHMQIHMEEVKQMWAPKVKNLNVDWKTEYED
jgi:hypothetical protein